MNSLSKRHLHLLKMCNVAWLIVMCLSTPSQSQSRRKSRRTTGSTRPPAMIGDFFGGLSGGNATVINFTDRTVHHTTSANDFHKIVEGGTVTFSGGPNATDAYHTGAGFGTPVPPIGDVVTGLTFFPTGQPGFVAVKTTDTVSILPADDNGLGLTGAPVYAVGLPQVIDLPNPSASGAVVGRVKIAENASPIPQDRNFFNYSYFDNVALRADGVNVHRFSPGIERTFFDELMSFEVRTPFAATLDSDILADGRTASGRAELGNVSLTGKALLISTGSLAISSGLQVTLPTADDSRVLLTDGTELVTVENRSVHLMPFLAALYTPNDSYFAQAFLQVDADANGNPVLFNTGGQGLTPVGRLNDPEYLYVDFSMGWFMYQSDSPDSTVTGITPMVELHYNRALGSNDAVSTGGFTVGDFRSGFESFNITIGTNLDFGPSTSLLMGYTAPVGLDQVFDGELRVSLNYYPRAGR